MTINSGYRDNEAGVGIDERLHPQGAVARDLGRNPAYTGVRPVTRQEKRANLGESVGGAFDRSDNVTSFAATPISVSAVSQTLSGGPGALKGFSILVEGSAAAFRLRSGGPNGVIIYATQVLTGVNVTEFFGDHGINFSSLYLEVQSGAVLTGSVWIASTE